MFENRDLRQDLFALALAAVAAFVLAALFTYSPAEPLGQPVWPLSEIYQPDKLIHPAAENIQNACGRLGAHVADVLLCTLGIGAYYLAMSLVVVAVLLLMRREIRAPLARLGGWLLSLVGLTGLFAIVLPGLSPGPVIGSGGYLGAMAGGLLMAQFALAGAVILALTMIGGGLLLCTDYVLLQLAMAVARPVGAGVSGAVKSRLSRRAKPAADACDDAKYKKEVEDQPVEEDDEESCEKAGEVEEEVEEEESVAEGAPRIKFRGRASVEVPDEDVTAEEEDQLEEQDAEVEVEDKIEDEKEEASSVPPPKFIKRKDRAHKSARPKKTEREEVMDRLDAAANVPDVDDYELPPLDLLLEGDDMGYEEQEKEVLHKAKMLEKTFRNFGFNVRVVEIETGPVIAQYEIELEAGLRLSKITNLADDLAIALRVPSVRIVAPIPGKNTVGIEVPNTNRQMVRLRDVMEEGNGRVKKMHIPIYLGKDVSGHPMVEDLARMPHLLIAGRTGTGKSVCLNAIISSMLMTRRPDEVRLLMIDPKMVELSGYGTLPHLMHPVVTDMRKAEAILAWAVEKMEERYSLLAKVGVRQISSYNQLSEEELYERLEAETDEERAAIPLHLPYIVIVADEMADLMMVAGKDVEQHIIRLAQKSRAVGIHLILATQKPTVDVITGLIKSNLPARLSFQVASRTDSRVVLDEMGAEKLLGDGDMLFLKPGTSQLLRGQGTYLSDDEIDAIVGAVSTGEQNFVAELVQLKPKEEEGDGTAAEGLKNRDELYESAIDIVVREQRGSVSLLQRNLGIGYGRAARLIDFMAEDGIVGAYAGSQAREVMLTMSDWERMQGIHSEEGEAASPEPQPKPAAKAATKARREAAPEPASRKTARAAATTSNSVRRRGNKIIPVPDWDDEEEDELQDDMVDETEDELESEEELEEDHDEYEDGDEDQWEEESDELEEDEEEYDEEEYEEYEDEECDEEYEEDPAPPRRAETA